MQPKIPMSKDTKIIHTIDKILKELDFLYRPKYKIDIWENGILDFDEDSLQRLNERWYIVIYSDSEDIYYEWEYKYSDYTREIRDINTLQLFEYKRELLWEVQDAVIDFSTLEKIARFIGDSWWATSIIKTLEKCKVPEYLIIYPNTKWRMVDDILRILATSKKEAGHKLLFLIIESFFHPIQFDSDELYLKVESDFNRLLKYDQYKIVEWKVVPLNQNSDVDKITQETTILYLVIYFEYFDKIIQSLLRYDIFIYHEGIDHIYTSLRIRLTELMDKNPDFKNIKEKFSIFDRLKTLRDWGNFMGNEWGSNEMFFEHSPYNEMFFEIKELKIKYNISNEKFNEVVKFSKELEKEDKEKWEFKEQINSVNNTMKVFEQLDILLKQYDKIAQREWGNLGVSNAVENTQDKPLISEDIVEEVSNNKGLSFDWVNINYNWNFIKITWKQRNLIEALLETKWNISEVEAYKKTYGDPYRKNDPIRALIVEVNKKLESIWYTHKISKNGWRIMIHIA